MKSYIGRASIHDDHGKGWFGDITATEILGGYRILINAYAPIGEMNKWDEVVLEFADGRRFVGKPDNMWASLTSCECGIDILFEEKFTEVLKI